ncbi:hypothetical protein GCM10028820_17270 [Tessaracoccus terricola]
MMGRNSFGALRRLPSGRYQASYIGRDGRRHSGPTTFTHKEDAFAWLGQERRLMEDGWTSPQARAEAEEEALAAEQAALAGPTVSEWLERCINERQTRSRRPLKTTTADNYRTLARLTIQGTEFGDLLLTEVTRDDVYKWRWSGPPSTRATQGGKAYELVVSVFKDAVLAGLIDATPCTLKGAGSPERKRDPEVLTVSEAQQYLGSIDVPWAHAALTLQVTCGLRLGEVLALRDKDLDLDAQTVTIAGSLARLGETGPRTLAIQDPKTKASRRTLSLLPHTVASLKTWRKSRGKLKPEDLLFPADDGGPLNHDVLRRIHKKAAKAIGREDLRDHDLRSTAATLAASAGATVREIQNMLGHTTPTMALRYQRATAERDAERARNMSKAWQQNTTT